MKFLLLLLAGWLPALALAQPATRYEINGYVKGLPDNAKLYLHDGPRRIDSATVRQEHFTLRGHLAEPVFAYLYLGRGRGSSKLTDFLLDNRALTITGDKPEYNSVTISGSDINAQLNDWLQADQQLGHYRYEIGQVYKVLQARQDTTALPLQRIMQDIQQGRVALLKAYVRRYHDSATGAALPTLCTLSASLTAADYTEMYQALTPNWQQTAFGREILAQAHKKGAAGPGK